MIIDGIVLSGREFEPVEGRVVVEDGEIAAVEEASVDSDAIVCPAFVNAHTHIGDSIAKEAGEGLTLQELVAPPEGLKHRLLRAADHEELVAAMARSLSYMEQSGTGAFVEFREGGVDGVEAIMAALEGSDLESVVLGRKTVKAMERADGFGASGANDADFGAERRATREAGKLFGIHAGEVDSADINPALDLVPDFLVHMVHAEELHMDRVADSEIPVVVCPRSNCTTGVGQPPVEALAERTTVALGTDNVFLNSPSMFREMALTSQLYDLSARDILRMATVNGADIAGIDGGLVEAGQPARLCVLDGDSDNLCGVHDPIRAVVRRAETADVERVVLAG
ncbi:MULTISPECIES: amidohydrolase family protein [Haloarcula]|uniref:amidohydrolase family protein n=1 Tax=Haloarcula TaxID=2237 RepID=UPI0023E844C1|nr:amidohydrolase family protein [Halomicroarcula sp. SHR3]